MTEDKPKQIAALNDQFRLKFFVPSFGPRPVPGHIVCTSGISALPPETQINIWSAVSDFNSLSEDNDPYGGHDFGAITMETCRRKSSGGSTTKHDAASVDIMRWVWVATREHFSCRVSMGPLSETCSSPKSHPFQK